MKKLTALALIIVTLFALTSCALFSGSSVNLAKYENDVNQTKFMEKFEKAAKDIVDEDYLKTNWKATSSASSKSEIVTEYKSDVVIKGSEESSSKKVIEYSDKDEIAHVKSKSKYSTKESKDKEVEEEAYEMFYVQDKDDFYTYNPETKMYSMDENTPEGAFDAASDAFDLDGLFSYINSFSSTDTEYYVDDNVFTIVYESEASGDAISYKYDGKTKNTVQIIIEDKKLTVYMVSETVYEREYDDYTETTTTKSEGSMVLEFTDVNITAPKKADYKKSKNSD